MRSIYWGYLQASTCVGYDLNFSAHLNTTTQHDILAIALFPNPNPILVVIGPTATPRFSKFLLMSFNLLSLDLKVSLYTLEQVPRSDYCEPRDGCCFYHLCRQLNLRSKIVIYSGFWINHGNGYFRKTYSDSFFCDTDSLTERE